MAAADAVRAVVLDTNVALDLLVFDDPSVLALRAALAGGHLRWLVLPGMRDELARVLTYPRVAAQLTARGKPAHEVLPRSTHPAIAVRPCPPHRCAAPIRTTSPFSTWPWPTAHCCSAKTRRCRPRTDAWPPWVSSWRNALLPMREWWITGHHKLPTGTGTLMRQIAAIRPAAGMIPTAALFLDPDPCTPRCLQSYFICS